jgi:hypothetical protein
MRADQLDQFLTMYRDVMGLYGKAATATQETMVFRALAAHDLRAVRAAFDAHIRDPQRGRFAPLPADILAQIEGAAENDGRPGAEEAWAMCLPAADEARTVVWTAEMAEAWGLARVVLDAGDEVGARMTFRETYGRLIASARKMRAAPQWSATLGHDEAMRADALRDAVSTGRLPLTALPAPSGPVAGLIELVQRPRGVPEHVKAKVQALRFAETPLQQQAREARERDVELKAAHAAKVADYAAAKGIEVTA